ncbi:MAG: hypothetical protein B7Y11_13755 [Sphingobacteriia bacterium 24-36-13]|jgi:hypothetical protein|uniref:hypothetical protein n=1 Tax=Sediminibacterium sp. TaxID=1917865 RepID=UPI000BD22F4E|nr:hypothetical protein [Sediminibacterium sp.]OYY07531.1 MAG: hypothetical protein B7Y66_12530 [Sphingobacteriia bacterium 35-36-14]OYZ51363.1 MAG: hypothetical protein B7Y11_13755 [Sphingobacteriia bacterium 24-36-13]OZA62710.1 MAG: hypothetical protein B7X68_12910 [Sphingobacteriia bacterium 39-36-14]HQS25515.1 hypothetical protein [Sediminibacterium sp.]HQS36335.1 hypothetical protein [Sediminibacterium sp.]
MSESEDFFGNAKKELEAYIENRILLAKMQVTQKLSHKMASVVVITLLSTLFAFALVFGGIMAAYYLTDLTGSLVKGFGYVAAFFLGLLLIVVLFRKKLATVVVDALIKNLFK